MGATRVTFYVLTESDSASRLSYACRLVEKAYKLEHRIHAHAIDNRMATALDTMLWTFRQGSFVPHERLVPGGPPPAAPVTIGADDDEAIEPPAADLLINLATGVPDFFVRFARVAEIIDGSPSGREAGRARHRFYRAQGMEPETHEVT